jgi:hypothetical protein
MPLDGNVTSRIWHAEREAIDIYYHIDAQDAKLTYMAHIPQLGT